jgi:hypothetical protein
LPPGFENWWEVGGQGILKPFPIKHTLADWNRWLGLPSKEARDRITKYQEAWKDRAQASAQLYEEIVQRRIASSEEAELQRQEFARRLREETNEFRRKFHDQYYNP